MRRLAFVLVAVLCAACASPTPSPTPTVAPTATPTASPTVAPTPIPTATPDPLAPADQQILRLYCCYSDPRALRPQAASGSDELAIIDGIQRGLLYRDGEGNLVPSLATDLPTVSSDLLTYTYHLGTDAKYSDGTPIVAGDIVRAARHLADPRNAFDLGYLMCYVAGATELLGKDYGCPEAETPYLDPAAGTFDDAQIDGLLDQLGVTAPDDHTVVFRLVQPTSYWPDITAMAQLTPVPEHQTSWTEAEAIVSSGPFVLSEWRHNQLIVLTPNPKWYGLAPTLQRIEMRMGADPGQAVSDWERGVIDEVRVPSSEALRILGTPEYASMVNRSSMLSVEWWDFANCNQTTRWPQVQPCPPNDAVTTGVIGRSPMQNVHFRQALTQALDKTELIDATFAGVGTPAYSPTMPGIPRFPTVTAENTPLPFNPAAALVKLAIALGELGVAEPDPADVPAATDDCDATCQHTKAWAKLLGPIRFGYNCDAGHDARVMYLAERWHEAFGFAGSQLDLRCTDFATFRGPRPPWTTFSDIARDGWGADFAHPDNQLRNPFVCNGRNNGSTYCNPAYDALLDQGAGAASYVASLPFYHQAEEQLVEDAPVLFLRYGESISLVRPWVINYVQTPSEHQNVGDTFYENIQIAPH